MEAYALKEFAQKHFGTIAKLAEHLDRPANSLSRLNSKGAVVVVDGDKFTIYKNGHTYPLSEKVEL
jgi:putative heme iron utilization protein